MRPTNTGTPRHTNYPPALDASTAIHPPHRPHRTPRSPRSSPRQTPRQDTIIALTDSRILAGRYRLEDLLGRGGMAEVWSATDEVLHRRVAVKVLLERFGQDSAFVERFHQEAQNAAALNHPNVVRVYDTGEDDGLPFIVMELVEGRSLADVIRAGGLTEDRSLEVVADVCAALGYAHEAGLVHRDVKPGNILLADDGEVKVTDFGIARAIDAETVTQTAAVLGTAAYLSPEQAQGQAVDARSDVYSLGVVLYETLTRSQPFTGDTPVTVAYQHVQEDPIPPRDIDATIAPAVEAIVLRAMAKNPANRYASTLEFRDDVLRARAGQDVAAPAVLRGEDTAMLDADAAVAPVVAASGRRRALGYVVLGIAALIAALGSFWLVGQMFTGEDARVVDVPDVTNQTEADAKALLRQRGLTGIVSGSDFSDTIEPGRVMEQSPRQGDQVEANSVVELVTSIGRQQVTVPDVSGMPESEALTVLRENLVPLNRTTEFSSTVEVGSVVRTNPSAGERVPVGTEVDYVVSAGEETVRVLSVVGQPESDARTTIEGQGFNVLVVREFSRPEAEGGVPNGRVIRQEPEAGTELPKGADVTLVISKGTQDPEPSPDDGGGGGLPTPPPVTGQQPAVQVLAPPPEEQPDTPTDGD